MPAVLEFKFHRGEPGYRDPIEKISQYPAPASSDARVTYRSGCDRTNAFSRKEIRSAPLNKIRGAHLRGLGIVARFMPRRFLVLCLLLPVAASFATEPSTQFKYPAAP